MESRWTQKRIKVDIQKMSEVLHIRQATACVLANRGITTKKQANTFLYSENTPLYPVLGEKPMKDASEWDSVGYAIWMKTLPDTPQFEFIKWTDEEPWAVEDLLKLEVEE